MSNKLRILGAGRWRSALAGALAFVTGVACVADPAPASRETLGGDWGGARTQLGEHGVNAQLEFTGYYQGMFSGDGEDDFEPAGRFDAFVDVDTGKFGLWQGGGLRTHIENRFGDIPPGRGGALWPMNTGTVLPLDAKAEVVFSSVYLTQRFGRSTNLMLGKINAVDLLARDPFFGGWGIHRFANIAFVAPPSGVVPPVITGAILSHAMGAYSITAMVFDPNDQTDNSRLDDLFSDGENYSLSGGWAGAVAGRSTNVAVTGTYSTAEGSNLEEILLPPGLKTGDKDGAYNVALQLGHLLVESPVRKGKGFGVYAKAATADGNPNAIQGSFVGGFAGHGIVCGRPNDSFGIGYYYYKFSDDLQDAVEELVEFDDEQGLEVFYVFAVTPWLRITSDLQGVDPAAGDNDAAMVGSLRANLVF